MSGDKSPAPAARPEFPPAGLCADCRHRRLQRGGRSLFVRCALARRDPSFPRYPRLPVTACRGYEGEDGG